jgi:hypothetical protein
MSLIVLIYWCYSHIKSVFNLVKSPLKKCKMFVWCVGTVETIPICEPWCWNMHTNICPCPKSASFVGFYIPAPWFASGICSWCSIGKPWLSRFKTTVLWWNPHDAHQHWASKTRCVGTQLQGAVEFPQCGAPQLCLMIYKPHKYYSYIYYKT